MLRTAGSRVASPESPRSVRETLLGEWLAILRRLRRGESALLGATIVVALCAVCAKVFVLGRDLAVAYRFGRGEAFDAFLLANLLPVTALNAIVGPVGFAVLPLLAERARTASAHEWNRLAQSTFAALLALVAIGCVVLAAVGPMALAFLASSAGSLAMSREFLWWLTPAFALQGVAGYLTLLIRAHERHAAVSLIPAVTPMVTAGFVLSGAMGPTALVVGVLVGAIIETVLVAVVSRRVGIRIGCVFAGADPQLREVLRRYASVALAATLMSATLIVDQAVAAMMGESGSVAAISYGTRLTSMMLALLVAPMATAALPHFSRFVASGNLGGARRTFWRYAGGLFVCGLLVVVVLAALSDTITRVLFQRGAFGPSDTLLVGSLQAIYVLVLPFALVEQLGVRVLAALGTTRTLAWIAAANFALNFMLDVVLMHFIGLRGVAIATVAVAAFSAGVIGVSVHRGASRSGSS